MALQCPTIIVTQSRNDLPFDIKDMQSVEYERSRLGTTLGQPLERMVVDTLSSLRTSRDTLLGQERLVGELLSQVGELRNMVAQAVHAWNPSHLAAQSFKSTTKPDAAQLQGAWVSDEEGSRMYATVVGSDLVVRS